jgi:hypothetical protein
MGVYPPWDYTYEGWDVGKGNSGGYHWIFSPPEHEDSAKWGVRLVIGQLLFQWFVAGAITGGVIVTFKDKKEKTPKHD